MVRTLRFQCRGNGFDPWLRAKIPHAAQYGQNKYIKIKYVHEFFLKKGERITKMFAKVKEWKWGHKSFSTLNLQSYIVTTLLWLHLNHHIYFEPLNRHPESRELGRMGLNHTVSGIVSFFSTYCMSRAQRNMYRMFLMLRLCFVRNWLSAACIIP